MKKKLLFFLLLALTACLHAEPTVFFSEDFESYSEGDFFSQRDDLKYYREGNKEFYTYDVTNVTSKCLGVRKNSGDYYDESGLWIPMGTQPSVFTDSGVLRIRFKIKSSFNMAGVMLGDGDEGRALYCYRNGGTFYIKNDNYEFGVGGVGDQVYTPLEMNISYPARRLMNVIVNSVTNTPENFVLDEYDVAYFGAAVFGAYPPKCCPIDDIEAAYEPRYAPIPTVSADLIEYSPDEGSKTLVIANDGGGYFNYSVTATEHPEWLLFDETNGVCAAACEIEFPLDRGVMTNGYYRTKLLVDLGTYGQKTVTLRAGSGRVFFRENFEAPYMTEGEITGQFRWDGKKDDGYGKPYNEMVVTNADFGWNGACAHYVRGSGWDGYTCRIDSPKGAVVKVSMMLLKSSAGDLDDFAIRQNYWNNAADFNLRCGGGEIKIYSFCSREETYPLIGERSVPLDEWFAFSFTLDYERYVLTSLTFGDFTTNYARGIPLRNLPNDFTRPAEYLNCIAISGGGERTADAGLYLDELEVELPAREYKPIPSWGGVTNLGDGGLTNIFKTTVLNYGAKDFDYSLKVLDHNYYFLPYSVSGSVSRAADLWFVIYKNYYSDGFFRSRVAMNYWDWDEANRGSLTSLYTYSKGDWYYTSDFEEPFYKAGALDGQDTWRAKGDQRIGGKLNKRQFLYMGGQGYARTSLKIPKNSEYKIKLYYYVERPPWRRGTVRLSGDNAALRDMDKNLKGNFPLYISRDSLNSNTVVSCMMDGALTNLLYAPLDAWNELSVVVDTSPGAYCVRSVCLNEDTVEFEEGALPLAERYMEKDIDMFDMNMEGDLGFYIDHLTVCAPDLPEPGVFALVSALALLLAARRKPIDVS